MTSEETTIVDDGRCLATGCRCLYTINGHLCQRCYWQRHGQIHAGWIAELGLASAPLELEVHPGWHDLAIVAKCRNLIAIDERFAASRMAARHEGK